MLYGFKSDINEKNKDEKNAPNNIRNRSDVRGEEGGSPVIYLS